MKAISIAYRSWAHAHPQRYQLIFGTPIPGYETPMEKVFESSARSINALFHVVEGLRAAGRLKVTPSPTIMDGYESQYEPWKAYFNNVHPNSMYAAMIIWARVHGIVSLEIQGNLPPYGKKGDALYLFDLETTAKQFIKE